MTLPFPLPVLFTSWGFRTHGDRWMTPDELADYAAAARCPSVAVQLGLEPTTEQPNCHSGEAQRLRERGLRVLVWGAAGGDYVRSELVRLSATPADWLPQIENEPERDLVLSSGLTASGIVTTYGGASTPSDCDQLRRLGVQVVLVEIYSETQTDVDLMLWQGTMYGWKASELYACFGTYRGELPTAYNDTQGIGRNWGLYLAEPMSSEQFYAWGDFNPPPKPPSPEPEDDMDPITDQQALDTHKTASQAALSAYADPKPKGRNTIIWRIANADDTTWNKARDKVLADLNAAGVPDVPA